MANHRRCSFDGDHPYLCPFISTASITATHVRSLRHPLAVVEDLGRRGARGRHRRCVQVRIAGDGDFLAAEIAAAATRLAGKQA
jgi:hypothetical protein